MERDSAAFVGLLNAGRREAELCAFCLVDTVSVFLFLFLFFVTETDDDFLTTSGVLVTKAKSER